MPIPLESFNKKYDFELFFEKDCDIDSIINGFFMNHDNEIKGDKNEIIHKIKKLIEEDRTILNYINGDGQDYLNRIGKYSYIRHAVFAEENNGKQYYVYCINSFI